MGTDNMSLDEEGPVIFDDVVEVERNFVCRGGRSNNDRSTETLDNISLVLLSVQT